MIIFIGRMLWAALSTINVTRPANGPKVAYQVTNKKGVTLHVLI